MSAVVETLHFEQGQLTFSAQAVGSGPIVLCLHGFPDNAGSFNYQLPALADAGYRALSLTLRGYEPSSIPADGDFSIEAVAGDVVTLIRALDAGPVHLIGHDWGAAVAYNAAATAPECFRSLTTIAVPHAGRFARDGLRIFKQLRMSWYMGFLIFPGSLTGRCNVGTMRSSANFGGVGVPDGAGAPYVGECGRYVLTTGVVCCRACVLPCRVVAEGSAGQQEGRRISMSRCPLALSGERDRCIASDVFEQLTVPEDFPAGVTFRRIPGAGHFAHQERPDVMNALILDWLRKHHGGA